MQAKRIVPCLDVKNGRVVKGVNFVGLVDAGDPVEIASAYNEARADELVLLDISATPEGRETMAHIVKIIVNRISIPLTVGGGIRSVDDARRMLDAGADKVSINTAALKCPELITKVAMHFGKQCITVAIDAKRRENHLGWDVYLNGGSVNTGRDAVEWAMEAEIRGAGEILLTSMDSDGTKKGYDIDLTNAISQAVSIPVIASGGAGTMEDFYRVLTEGGADAALAASLFHFREIEIKDLKKYLLDRNISVKL